MGFGTKEWVPAKKSGKTENRERKTKPSYIKNKKYNQVEK